MKKTENTKTIIEVLQGLTPRQALDKKAYKDYYDGLTEVLTEVYKVYQGREKGKPINESEVMTKVTNFLHTLGKVNGKYISVCEKTSENGQTSVLFDTLVYHSFKDRIYTKSTTLASLENEKAKASKAKAKAHANLINGKGTAKDYKEAVKTYDEVIAKITTERAKQGSEAEATTMESPAKFIKFATARLKAIINNRLALSPEEAEALRKLRNKESKEKRSKAKPEAKTTTAKAKKPEAVKPEADKKSA